MKGKPKKSKDCFKNKGKERSYQKNMVPAQCEKHFPFDLFPLLRVNNQINPNGRFEVSKAKKATLHLKKRPISKYLAELSLSGICEFALAFR